MKKLGRFLLLLFLLLGAAGWGAYQALFADLPAPGEIGSRLAQEMGWDEARSFAHARDLFLSLVQHVVCVPKNPLELDK